MARRNRRAFESITSHEQRCGPAERNPPPDRSCPRERRLPLPATSRLPEAETEATNLSQNNKDAHRRRWSDLVDEAGQERRFFVALLLPPCDPLAHIGESRPRATPAVGNSAGIRSWFRHSGNRLLVLRSGSYSKGPSAHGHLCLILFAWLQKTDAHRGRLGKAIFGLLGTNSKISIQAELPRSRPRRTAGRLVWPYSPAGYVPKRSRPAADVRVYCLRPDYATKAHLHMHGLCQSTA